MLFVPIRFSVINTNIKNYNNKVNVYTMINNEFIKHIYSG